MKKNPFQKRKGVALVITLSAVILLTVLMVAFFSRSVLNRQIAFTSTNLNKADALARTSLDVVVGEIRQEMVVNSEPQTGSGPAVYLPKEKTAAGGEKQVPGMVPEKMGVSSPDGTGRVTLAKVSGDNIGIFTDPDNTAGNIKGSNVSIETASLNGRSISKDKWFGDHGPLLGSQSTLPTWVLVTRNNGMKVPSLAAAANRNSGDYVIGRFAYTVYDVSGLLDINAAGHPSDWTPDQVEQAKATLAAIDVKALGLALGLDPGLDPDGLLKWRNPISEKTYFTHVANYLAGNGFTEVAAGDSAFLNRRDLIRAMRHGQAGLAKNEASVLGHLTTFTRETAAPSWRPSTPQNSTTKYAEESDNTASPNRFMPRVFHTKSGTITRYDKNAQPKTYSVQAGDPLLQRRFPLERLNWLGPEGPQNGGTPASIQACFGLRWMPSEDLAFSGGTRPMVWRYVGPTGTEIQSAVKTLDEIAKESQPREPNFFELLQAGILSGSLGVNCGDPKNSGGSLPILSQRSATFQLFQIGAAIIDQYDADSYPTGIEYRQDGIGSNSIWRACGIENLPYANLFTAFTGSVQGEPLIGPAPKTSNAAVYQAFGLWNPNRSPVSVTPPSIRLRVQGPVGVFTEWSAGADVRYFQHARFGWGYQEPVDTTIMLANTPGKGAQGFTSPGLLKRTDIDGGVPANPGPTGNGWTETPMEVTKKSSQQRNAQFVAYRMPNLYLNKAGNEARITADSNWPGANNENTSKNSIIRVVYGSQGKFQFSLEFQDPSGAWIPYSFVHGNNDPQTWISELASYKTYLGWDKTTLKEPLASICCTFDRSTVYLRSDPRTGRFGVVNFVRDHDLGNEDATQRAPEVVVTPLWPTEPQVGPSSNSSGAIRSFTTCGYGGPEELHGRSIPEKFGTFYYSARLCRNNTENSGETSSYTDMDGVRRIADGGLFTAAAGGGVQATGNPYQNPSDRQIILNRPFRSVAELGYAYRDMPWKTLDLFSQNSADAGLLDLFSLTEESPAVTAGRVNLNSQDPLVLQAIIQGTRMDEMNTVATPLASPDKLAKMLVGFTARDKTPLVGKEDLAAKVLPSSAFTGVNAQKAKPLREAFVRALADVGQTRTWNLLIDLVAQTGRYPTSATGLDKFLVEGERRYWLHVAIDRFTGKVVDYELEQAVP